MRVGKGGRGKGNIRTFSLCSGNVDIIVFREREVYIYDEPSVYTLILRGKGKGGGEN